MKTRLPVLALLATAAFTAGAQQIYRWTDERGRVNVTDTPPPASATNVQRKKPVARGAAPESAQQPFELREAMRESPVTLYTSSNCKQVCASARALLNRRGIPFKEVQVSDEASVEELTRVSGGEDIPTLVVGRSVHRGYEQGGFGALLDSARYPRAGLLPVRSQAAPGEAPKPAAVPPAPSGPYAPRPQRN